MTCWTGQARRRQKNPRANSRLRNQATKPTGKPDAPSPIIDGEDVGGAEEDPLARVGRQMRAVEGLIERQDSADETAHLQKRIVSDLAKVIEQLESQSQKPSNSKQSSQQQKTAERKPVKQPGNSSQPGDKPNEKPPSDSTDRLGKNDVQRVDMDQMKGLLKDLWGQLPLRDREQMLQSSPEQFLPKYELLIEKYYKRLAEQQKKE